MNNNDVDFPKAIRRAASEASKGSRRSKRSGMSRSNISSSYYSRSTSQSQLVPLGMTLKEQQEHVQNEAWARHVAALERDAKQTVIDNNFYGRTVQGGIQEEKNEAQRAKNLAKQHQEQLRNQMENNKARRAETRREFIESASSHSFPLFTETFISETEVEAYRKAQKEKWRNELNEQARVNQTLQNVENKIKEDHNIEQVSLALKSLEKNRAKEHREKMSKGNNLKAAWDRDIRLKGIQKAIVSGKDMTHHAGVETSKFEGRSPGHTGYVPLP